MTGPEHYAAAELLATMAAAEPSGADLPAAHWLAHAQVHATLALAAATVLAVDGAGQLDTKDQQEWCAVGVLR